MTALRCYASAAAIAAFLLAACDSGAQGIAPGAPVSGVGQANAHDRSRRLPEASSQDYLYVNDASGRHVYAYSYPDMQLVGQLTGTSETVTGLCADKQGEVFVTEADDIGSEKNNFIVEFAHGGTDPIASLKDSHPPSSCSVDPTTGNLAVTNWANDDVAIYANAQGTPTYIPTALGTTDWAAYDSDGNLFVSGTVGIRGYALAELASGSSSFTKVSLNESIGLGALQWNDGYLVTSFRSTSDMMLDLYRIRISGSSGTVVGTTVLDERKKLNREFGQGQTLIIGHSVFAAGTPRNRLQLWRYPSGGKARKTVITHLQPWGIALSVAPSK